MPTEFRQVDPQADAPAIRALWLAYLTWGNDELQARYGFRLPVAEAVERDLAQIAKFLPPDGCLLLALREGEAVGIACRHRINPTTAQLKRMCVRPPYRGSGLGAALLERVIGAAAAIGYRAIRLDCAGFMSGAHALYRTRGFKDIAPYAESEIPDPYKRHWVFTERSLTG